MADSDKVFAGSIPKTYEDYLVPLIFEGFSEDMGQRVVALSPRSLLETAAGTGVLTRAIAARLPADTRYVVTDLNEPMLTVASHRQGQDPRISWQQANALALPFADAEFDVVCCQFGAMFFPDRVKGYREARRVLRRNGTFLFSVWDRIEENIFANDVTLALAEMFPDDPPRFMVRVPHGYHDEAVIGAEVAQAGFAHVEIEKRSAVSRAPSPKHVAIAYCQGTPLRNEIEARDPNLLVAATELVAKVIAARHGTGEIAAKIQGFVITARF